MTLAHSGADALEKAKRVRPDIGVFDIGMPDQVSTDPCQLRPFVCSSA